MSFESILQNRPEPVKGNEHGKQVKTVSGVGRKASRRRCDARIPRRLEPNASQLLPGLQNDFVLMHIVPKLPWRAFHVLSSVSPHWQDAITTLQVYDARIQSNAMEKLVILNHPDPDNVGANAISIYSMRDDWWHQLPKFPFYKKGIPPKCQFAAVDGKFYVIGGKPHDEVRRPKARKTGREVLGYSDGRPQVPNTGSEVFVLDVVGQRGWKRCADLPGPRQDFTCAVLDGKIYLLGGVSNMFERTSECLMYHPNEDRWSSIAPMIAKRCFHHAAVVGGELWVHGGEFGWREKASYFEVYHPAKDKWSRVESKRRHESERLFAMSGKAYLITPDAIYGPNEKSKTRSWTHARSIFFSSACEDVDFKVVAAQAVDDELLALFDFGDDGESEVVLYRSRGFGTEEEEVDFEVTCAGVLSKLQGHLAFMCPIEL